MTQLQEIRARALDLQANYPEFLLANAVAGDVLKLCAALGKCVEQRDHYIEYQFKAFELSDFINKNNQELERILRGTNG